MPFIGKRYPRRRPPAPGTVLGLYDDTAQIQAQFVDQAERQARLFLWLFLGALVMCGYLSGVLAWQRSQPSVAVHVVHVEQGTGRVLKLEPASKPYQPALDAIGRQVINFVTDTFLLSTDAKMTGDAIDRAYSSVTLEGKNRLDTHFAQRNPRAHQGKKAIYVKVDRVVYPNATTVDITWREIVTLASGMIEVFQPLTGPPRPDRPWSGQYLVQLRQPHDTVEAINNPLGIWIDSWSITPL